MLICGDLHAPSMWKVASKRGWHVINGCEYHLCRDPRQLSGLLPNRTFNLIYLISDNYSQTASPELELMNYFCLTREYRLNSSKGWEDICFNDFLIPWVAIDYLIFTPEEVNTSSSLTSVKTLLLKNPRLLKSWDEVRRWKKSDLLLTGLDSGAGLSKWRPHADQPSKE